MFVVCLSLRKAHLWSWQKVSCPPFKRLRFCLSFLEAFEAAWLCAFWKVWHSCLCLAKKTFTWTFIWTFRIPLAASLALLRSDSAGKCGDASSIENCFSIQVFALALVFFNLLAITIYEWFFLSSFEEDVSFEKFLPWSDLVLQFQTLKAISSVENIFEFLSFQKFWTKNVSKKITLICTLPQQKTFGRRQRFSNRVRESVCSSSFGFSIDFAWLLLV